MKLNHRVCVLVIVNIALFGCVSKSLPPTPAQTAIQTLSPTQVPLTATPVPSPTQTATLTPPATLEPEQAQETIQGLLREPVDCDAPCFWGIVPGQTTLGEAVNIFTRLGLQTKKIRLDKKEFYSIDHDFDNGVSIGVNLTTQDKLVENLRIYITPEKQKAGVPRMWSAYSPETLIKRYGLPSRVGFAVDRGPHHAFEMVIYFDSVDLIAEYSGHNILGGTVASPQVCPLTDQFDSVGIWMGKNPEYPPYEGIPLDKVTSMTMEEFSKLITGTSNNACFNLKGEAFP